MTDVLTRLDVSVDYTDLLTDGSSKVLYTPVPGEYMLVFFRTDTLVPWAGTSFVANDYVTIGVNATAYDFQARVRNDFVGSDYTTDIFGAAAGPGISTLAGGSPLVSICTEYAANADPLIAKADYQTHGPATAGHVDLVIIVVRNAASCGAASLTEIQTGDGSHNAIYELVVEGWTGGTYALHYIVPFYADDYDVTGIPFGTSANNIQGALYNGAYPGTYTPSNYFAVTGSGTTGDPFVIEFNGTYSNQAVSLEFVGSLTGATCVPPGLTSVEPFDLGGSAGLTSEEPFDLLGVAAGKTSVEPFDLLGGAGFTSVEPFDFGGVAGKTSVEPFDLLGPGDVSGITLPPHDLGDGVTIEAPATIPYGWWDPDGGGYEDLGTVVTD